MLRCDRFLLLERRGRKSLPNKSLVASGGSPSCEGRNRCTKGDEGNW